MLWKLTYSFLHLNFCDLPNYKPTKSLQFLSEFEGQKIILSFNVEKF